MSSVKVYSCAYWEACKRINLIQENYEFIYIGFLNPKKKKSLMRFGIQQRFSLKKKKSTMIKCKSLHYVYGVPNNKTISNQIFFSKKTTENNTSNYISLKNLNKYNLNIIKRKTKNKMLARSSKITMSKRRSPLSEARDALCKCATRRSYWSCSL